MNRYEMLYILKSEISDEAKEAAAFDFLRYFFSDDVIMQHNLASGTIPAKEAVAQALAGVRHTLKNSISSQSGCELTVQIHAKKKSPALTEQLTAIQGVSSAMLIEYTGDN